MRRGLGSALLFVAATSLSAPIAASASHPTQMCLDIEPEAGLGYVGGGGTESLYAYPGATDAGHPPEHEGCVTELVEPGQDWSGTNIDFEISGVGDPDGSNTPATPDMTCTVADGSASCAISPPAPPYASGTQVFRAWIDNDQNDSTTEADLSEDRDERKHPGDTGEPDQTDVSHWDWVFGPPGSPCDEPPCEASTRVTIEYRGRTGAFRGEVRSRYHDCVADRVVTLWKVRPGEDRYKARTRARSDGRWKVGGFEDATGRHYVRVIRTVIHNERAEPLIECGSDRSPTIRLD